MLTDDTRAEDLLYDGLLLAGEKRTDGTSEYAAKMLGDDEIIVARIDLDGACSECRCEGTYQRMPEVCWFNGGWFTQAQCGNCGSLCGEEAPYQIVPATAKAVAGAIKNLAARTRR